MPSPLHLLSKAYSGGFRSVDDMSRYVAKMLKSHSELQPIDAGSNRVVYDLGDRVAKLAIHPQGLSALKEYSTLFPPSDRVAPDLSIVDKVTPIKSWASSPGKLSAKKASSLVKELHPSPNLDDLLIARNWGLDKSGNLVLLDEGAISPSYWPQLDTNILRDEYRDQATQRVNWPQIFDTMIDKRRVKEEGPRISYSPLRDYADQLLNSQQSRDTEEFNRILLERGK